MAEYSKPNKSNQAMVKPSPLQLGTLPPQDMVSIPKQFSESMYRFWRLSLLHDTFSVSLPIMEESAFEEKFKYLIVTSHLLNDTLSTHPKQQKQAFPPSPPSPIQTATVASHTRSATIGTAMTLTGLLAALGFEHYMPFQQNDQQEQQYETESSVLTFNGMTPTITMMLASSVSLFFIYRHLRRSSIRKLYHCALTRLQDFLEQSQLLDNKVHRALVTIQEIDWVSQGYPLSTPTTTSPIPATTTTKRYARRQLRSQLARLLRRAFIIYEEAIIDLSDWVNKSTLTRLFDMYSIQSMATLSSATTTTTQDDDDDITLDYLKTLAHLMHLKRRECMLQFLALCVMTGDHDSSRKGYETGWKHINSVLLMVKNETTGFAKDIKEALDNEYGSSPSLETTLGMTETQQQFIHQLELLDQHLRTTEARIYLCHDEVRQRKQRKELDLDQQQALKKEYMAMEKDIQQLVTEWQAGKQALDTLLLASAPPSPLPSPTTSSDDWPSKSLEYDDNNTGKQDQEENVKY